MGAEFGDFVDTAVFCSLLDEVISVDTSLAHLCGSLGIKTTVILPYLPDWRWQLNRQDSPWYLNMKLIRQVEYGDWRNVFEELGNIC